ncbi:MAG: T9SS type A sorting domain-containing protein [Bacteroidia bacterium]
MKKQLLCLLASIFCFNEIKSQTIAQARAATLGSTVTVRGIVTNGGELGNIRYLQDATGGITAFGTGLASITTGDSVTIIGPTTQYNNLLEISPVNSFTVHGNKPVPAPNIVTPLTFNESVEGTLIRINNATFSSGGTFAGNTNYVLTSNSQTFAVRIDASNTNLVGTTIPATPVDIIGDAAQFCTSPTNGCTNGYQMHPRTSSDIIILPLGLNNNKNNSQFIIYPNPANETFTIKTSDELLSVSLTDMKGRLVYSGNSNQIDVSTFNSGLYTLAINTLKGTFYKKMSVE